MTGRLPFVALFSVGLLFVGGAEAAPAVVPRGTIVFAGAHEGSFGIYSLSAGGSQLGQLTRSPVQDTAPPFSPDGRRILFLRGAGYATVPRFARVMNADGSGQRQLAAYSVDPAVAARSLTISWRQVASFRFRIDGSFSSAVAALGRPSSIVGAGAPGDCWARWAALRLRVRFYSLGDTKAVCSSFASTETVSPRFATPKGIRVGTPARTLHRLYPRARFHRGPAFAGAGSWWLVTQRYAVGPFSYPALYARVRNGRVSALGASYPSGGD